MQHQSLGTRQAPTSLSTPPTQFHHSISNPTFFRHPHPRSFSNPLPPLIQGDPQRADAMQEPAAQYLIQRFPAIHEFLDKLWVHPRIFGDVYTTYLAFQCAEGICNELRIDLSRPNAPNNVGISVSEIRLFTHLYAFAPQTIENRRTSLTTYKTLFQVLRRPDVIAQHPELQANRDFQRFIKYCTHLFQYHGCEVLTQVSVTLDEYISVRTAYHERVDDGEHVRMVRWHVMNDLQTKVAHIPPIRDLLHDEVSHSLLSNTQNVLIYIKSLWRSAFDRVGSTRTSRSLGS